MKGSSKMAVDLSPISLLDCGGSFGDTLIFGNGAAIVKLASLEAILRSFHIRADKSFSIPFGRD
jgi:hypothetical protein